MVKVKLCGFTREEDVEIACILKPDMIGAIVEIPGSPRSLPIERARIVLDAVSGDISKVAVVDMNNLKHGIKIAQELKPDYLQVHSTFPVAQLEELKKRTGVKLAVVIAIPKKAADFQQTLKRSLEVSKVADYILIDTKGPTGGGTGTTHDWSLSSKIREAIPKPMFLAGGLNPSNVSEAVKKVRPYGVDVSSGIESSPGKKDFKLMREFIEAVRQA